MRVLGIFMLGLTARAQTQIDLSTQAKKVDFSKAGFTRPLQTGTTLPGSCAVGQMFFKSDASAGANVYACTASNEWSVQGGISGVDCWADASSQTLRCQDNSGNTYTLVKSASSGVANQWVDYIGQDGTPHTSRPTAAAVGAVADPGTNGVVYRTNPGAATQATADQLSGPFFCQDAGTSSNYSCSLTPAIIAYSNGTAYWFRANTTNSGSASLNLNGLGPKTIVKHSNQALSAGDILAGQWVMVIFDGGNLQMQSQTGNGAGAVSTVFGRSGAIAAQSGDYTTSQVTESGNLYFTNARVLSAISGLYESPLTFAGPLSRSGNTISLSLATPTISGSSVLKGANGNAVAAAASDIVSLFSTCSGTQYLGADGACHTSTAGMTPNGSSGDLQANNGSGGLTRAPLNVNSDASVTSSKAVTWAPACTPTVNGGGTTTCDLSCSNVCQVPLTANTTLAFSNPHGSGPYLLRTVQNSTGGWSYTAFPGTARGMLQPDSAASAVTEQMITYDGTNYNGGAVAVPNSAWHGFSVSESSNCPAAAAAGVTVACADSTVGLRLGRNGGGLYKVVTTSGAGTDYAPATSGSAPLKGNGAGGTSNATSGDVIGLWSSGSCAGYLKSDGTCGTPSSSSNYASYQSKTATLTMTGSDVTMYTFSSVPALAAGACYRIGIIAYDASGGDTQSKIYVDSTYVGDAFGTTGGTAWIRAEILLCNAAGSQSTQYWTVDSSQYANGGGWSSNSWPGGTGAGIGAAPSGGSVDWSTSHTIYIKANGASGRTVVGDVAWVKQ